MAVLIAVRLANSFAFCVRNRAMRLIIDAPLRANDLFKPVKESHLSVNIRIRELIRVDISLPTSRHILDYHRIKDNQHFRQSCKVVVYPVQVIV